MGLPEESFCNSLREETEGSRGMSVRIDRVVTRGGDRGETSLGDGTRLKKSAAHIEAIGALDETNAVIGALISHLDSRQGELSARLRQLQNLLFDMGGDLCMPMGVERAKRVDDRIVALLEAEILRLQAAQLPLTSFILPGGSVAAAWAHLVRTSVRKSERVLVGLSDVEKINPVLVPILNRLSDYFFVLGRHLNDDGKADVLWKPGAELFGPA